MTRLASALCALMLVAGCSSTPPPQPPHWVEGGAPLTLGRARWERPNIGVVDLLEDGRILVDGAHLLTIDVVGRVVDPANEPVALLEQEGSLYDSDYKRLGGVGVASASPPDSKYAWLILGPDGQVTRYAADGESRFAGQWRGCEGVVMRSCTLVSHLILLRDALRASASPSGGGSFMPDVGFGLGVGLGIGIGIRLRR